MRKIYALIVGILSFAANSLGQTTVTFSTPGTSTWTVPAGVTSITVSAWEVEVREEE